MTTESISLKFHVVRAHMAYFKTVCPDRSNLFATNVTDLLKHTQQGQILKNDRTKNILDLEKRRRSPRKGLWGIFLDCSICTSSHRQ